MNHTVIDAGIGLTPGAPVEANTEAFRALFSDTLVGAALRARAAVCIGTQAWEFQAHDVEVGFNYPDGALVPDGSDPAPRDPTGREYTPTTRPGHRLPHAWLARGGDRVSTHDLVGAAGGFALITGADSDTTTWRDATVAVAEKFGVTITHVVVGAGGDLTDPEDTWNRVRQIQPDGAVLVRPDHHVAYRAAQAPSDAVDALSEAFGAILAR